MSKTTKSWCSWCFLKTRHKLVDHSYLSRNVYECPSCHNQTLECRAPGCANHTKGSPKETSEKGFLTGLRETWNDEFCAEHDGTVVQFEKLGQKLKLLDNYPQLFEDRKFNLAKASGIGAGVASGAIVLGPLAFLGAGPVAAALGAQGLLGAAGTGTAIAELSGAALTSASLAAIGGASGMAGGVFLIAASGAALGGVRGGVITNAYIGQVRDFDLRRLERGSGGNVIFVNGFLQQKELTFEDWRLGTEALTPDARRYGVTWESKSLYSLGTSLGSASRKATLAYMKRIALKATSSAAAKLNPLHWADLVTGMFDNDWHTAMHKAGMTGLILADILSRTPQAQSHTLLGHSLGARVLFYTLLNLSTAARPRVADVYMFGGAVDRLDDESWALAASAVTGKIYNFYSANDSVLKYLYQGANALLSDPIGFGPITCTDERIINIDVTDMVSGHLDYKSQLPELLARIQ